MHPLLTIAIRAARRAGEIIAHSIPRLESLEVAAKGRNDFVSEVDRAAEREIVAIIRRHYPDHAILAEEGGEIEGSEARWIIDPLDGTTNFLHGFPVFAVSIACEVRGRTEIGVVYDVMRQELFTATRGAGAQCEQHRIRVSKQLGIDGSLIATGFPYRATDEHTEAYINMFRIVTKRAAGIRRPGAAAIDLAYVAAGRVDGFWELDLQPWDTAAGALLVQESGGHIGTIEGGEYHHGGSIVAGNPRVYAELIEAFRPFVPR